MIENSVTKQLERYAATREMDYKIRLKEGKLYLVSANGHKLKMPVKLGMHRDAATFIKNVTTNDNEWPGRKRNQY